jgi:hypothetical protein
MLPLKEKSHEICSGDWLNFFAQVADGTAVDSGKQPAMTPLLSGKR